MRLLSLGLVLFALLSSGRALVPGMCATLAATQDAQRGKCTTTTCCSVAIFGSSPDSPSLREEKKRVECAFCHLATGIIHYEASVVLDAPIGTPSPTTLAQLECPDLTALWNYSRPRDPPGA
jgi:hypothetical protein